MILQKTIELINQKLFGNLKSEVKISQVVIGIGYTGVELRIQESPFLGVSYTLLDVLSNKECSKIDFAGILTKRRARELLEWALEPLSIKKIIGIATINAISQFILQEYDGYNFLEGDLFRFLKIKPDTKITFIGLIKPMIKKLSQITQNITIIERNLEINPFFQQFKLANDFSELTNEELNTNILICTGTALINGTIENILEAYKEKAEFIAIIGPTASMLPDALFNNGVNLVGGMFFEDSKSSLRVLQEGGGTRFFKKYGRKYNLIPIT
ncbi:MAG: hypothetical protein EU547_02945 [Promethearchaeota archaeon]|nr:MAG: hypothetical protein EU547_02945 [Candidatus Lokiarchaeota archaeon]